MATKSLSCRCNKFKENKKIKDNESKKIKAHNQVANGLQNVFFYLKKGQCVAVPDKDAQTRKGVVV